MDPFHGRGIAPALVRGAHSRFLPKEIIKLQINLSTLIVHFSNMSMNYTSPSKENRAAGPCCAMDYCNYSFL